ncbi:hypothetical protein AB6846_26260, partial [Serratia proteamaculans]
VIFVALSIAFAQLGCAYSLFLFSPFLRLPLLDLSDSSSYQATLTEDLMTIRAVVFDFGGVLFDWSPQHLYRKLIANDVERRSGSSTPSAPRRGTPSKMPVAPWLKPPAPWLPNTPNTRP